MSSRYRYTHLHGIAEENRCSSFDAARQAFLVRDGEHSVVQGIPVGQYPRFTAQRGLLNSVKLGSDSCTDVSGRASERAQEEE